MVRSILFLIAVLVASPTLLAQTHYGVNQNRNVYGKDVFVDQSVVGVFGNVTKSGNAETFGVASQSWRGYGLKNGVGTELFRFMQLSLTHTLLNLRSNASSLEHLNGSELTALVSFSFNSPIGNLFFGTGFHGSTFSYQNFDKSSTFGGLGQNHMLGINYFLNDTISIYGKVEKTYGSYRRNGGSNDVDSLSLTSDGFGLGVMIWL